MTPILARIRRTLHRHSLCPPGTRVLIALSGGSDSVGMLWTLHALSATDAFSIAGVAHFNHQLRPAAPRDEAFCRGLAARLGYPFLAGTADVAARAAATGRSVEDAARRERYAFLDAAADQLGADCVATGHTRDDQAETFLMKLARGAGPTGLGGIYPRRGRLIRPVIDVTREELRACLVAQGETWVEDETNADRSNPRNRIRHELLPALEAGFGPSLRAALARAAGLAAEDAAWLDALAAERFAALALPGPAGAATGGLQLEADALGELPRPLASRVLLLAMRAQTAREVGLPHVEGALDVLAGRTRAAATPAGRWELLDGMLVLLPRGLDRRGSAGSSPAAFRYELDVPGEVTVAEANCVIGAQRVSLPASTAEVHAFQGRADLALVSQANTGRLLVRSRRPGDWLRLPGSVGRKIGGRKKLQDVFVDARVPRSARDRVPVVTTGAGDGEDRVVWVPGHAISADFRVNGGEDAVILLKFTRVGGKT